MAAAGVKLPLRARTLTTSSGFTISAETMEAPPAAMERCSRDSGAGSAPCCAAMPAWRAGRDYRSLQVPKQCSGQARGRASRGPPSESEQAGCRPLIGEAASHCRCSLCTQFKGRKCHAAPPHSRVDSASPAPFRAPHSAAALAHAPGGCQDAVRPDRECRGAAPPALPSGPPPSRPPPAAPQTGKFVPEKSNIWRDCVDGFYDWVKEHIEEVGSQKAAAAQSGSAAVPHHLRSPFALTATDPWPLRRALP